MIMLRHGFVKRALTDPQIVSGIGNAYSDEILHRARLSPFKLTTGLSDDELDRLHVAAVAVLDEWTGRLLKADWPRTVDELERRRSGD